MPRRDSDHDLVVGALEREGWTITDDPLVLPFGGKEVYVDLGAERVLGAVKGTRKIAVEIKTFLGPSDVHDLELAIGQYNLYRDILSETDPERSLHLAVPVHARQGIFSDPLGRLVLERQNIKMIVFGTSPEEGLQWIP